MLPLLPLAEQGIVYVHIESDVDSVQLRRHEGDAIVHAGAMTGVISTDSIVCRTPCNRIVDARDGQEYFISGRGVTDSSRFQLYNYSGPVRITVDPGTQGYRTLGKVLTYGSIPFIVFGGLMFYTARGFKDDPDPELREEWRSAEKTYGLVAAGGLAMLTTGVVLWITSSTTYSIEPMRAGADTTGARLRVTF